MIRIHFALIAACLLTGGFAHAQGQSTPAPAAPIAGKQAGSTSTPAAKPAPPPRSPRLFLAVSEGTSGGINASEAVEKYRGLADVLSKAAGVPVVLSLVRSFEALEAGMKKGEFDLVMARPSDYPARGVRDYGYSLVATAKPDGQCFFIVDKASPINQLADAKGKVIMFPEKVAYMTRFCSAELRDQGFDLTKEQIAYAKEQGAVGWSVENKLVDAGGVASYSGVAKNWEKNGHRVIHKSGPRPYFPLIAHKRVSKDRVAKMQKALADLATNDPGKAVLQTAGIQGYNIEDSKRLLELLAWLEKR
ncbi:MAG: PhnD/SsuA/transferrin family substrate-binding protein [Betaproteobacteria bacterium]|nr:PhnD/SsuA/transferrin family substrate-binding protein [Betaproteobacteria bacterium]